MEFSRTLSSYMLTTLQINNWKCFLMFLHIHLYTTIRKGWSNKERFFHDFEILCIFVQYWIFIEMTSYPSLRKTSYNDGFCPSGASFKCPPKIHFNIINHNEKCVLWKQFGAKNPMTIFLHAHKKHSNWKRNIFRSVLCRYYIQLENIFFCMLSW